jgi:hypothetical protein
MKRIAVGASSAMIALLGLGQPSPAAPQAQAAPPVRITYFSDACLGFCPVYRISVSADGSGVFEGIAYTRGQGRHGFKASPAQYRAFAAALAPLRPLRGDIRYDPESRCGPSITDMPSTTVTWKGADRKVQRLYFYHGCDFRRFGAIAERLRRAPAFLPVADLIRSDPSDRRR